MYSSISLCIDGHCGIPSYPLCFTSVDSAGNVAYRIQPHPSTRISAIHRPHLPPHTLSLHHGLCARLCSRTCCSNQRHHRPGHVCRLSKQTHSRRRPFRRRRGHYSHAPSLAGLLLALDGFLLTRDTCDEGTYLDTLFDIHHHTSKKLHPSTGN